MDMPHHNRFKSVLLLIGVGLLLLATGWLLAWQLTKSPTLLPAATTQQITGFTPYFYNNSVPAGYTFDPAALRFTNGILVATLTKQGAPSITMTQQRLPADLTDDAIQQNAETVATNVGKASINTIEGRLLGSFIVRDRNTLILFNCSGDANKDDIRALLQNLVAAR